MVGDEFSRKPYALATQQGSPLKDSLNNAYSIFFLSTDFLQFYINEKDNDK